ncbi:MAG: hypothetical protein RLZZ416_55 [Candidatus Parcubacteria bacterium]|jgi:hypothetical protein
MPTSFAVRPGDAMMVRMKKKKKVAKQEEGYSPAELRIQMHAYIKASALRLRNELRETWKKQQAEKKRARHEITV